MHGEFDLYYLWLASSWQGDIQQIISNITINNIYLFIDILFILYVTYKCPTVGQQQRRMMMRFIVWKCDWADDTNDMDSWFIACDGTFSTLGQAKQWLNSNVGNNLGGKWEDAITFVCFCKDADAMGTWVIMPTSVPTCDVDATLWAY